jgi:hypothetical protein
MLQMPLLLWVLENTTLSYVSAAWPVQVSLCSHLPPPAANGGTPFQLSHVCSRLQPLLAAIVYCIWKRVFRIHRPLASHASDASRCAVALCAFAHELPLPPAQRSTPASRCRKVIEALRGSPHSPPTSRRRRRRLVGGGMRARANARISS